jgi:hypothetical protein
VRSLPFVEPESVRTSLSARRALFRVKPGEAFDPEATRKALADSGYAEVEVVTVPGR